MELLKNKIWVIILVIISMSFVVGVQEHLGIFKQNSEVLLTQVCSNCTYVNISYVAYPNNTFITTYTNVVMTKSGVYYTKLLVSNYTQDYGKYVVCGFGDLDGQVTTWCYDFTINGTGREEPSGIVLGLFLVIFLTLCFGLVLGFVKSIGHFAQGNFDLMDLATNLGLFFMVLGLYILQNQYLGHPMMDSILEMLVFVGGFTHVVVSFIFFFITIVKANLDQKNFKAGIK